MKKILLAVLVLNLTACAGMLKPVGDWFDAQDECQIKSRPKGKPAPDYCGASAGKSLFITPGNARNNYIVVVK